MQRVSPQHNLNIQSYSFPEILALFDIPSYDISADQMKAAKRKVLMTHPDKSRLPPEYFLFYKKAYEIIFHYYENLHKIETRVPTEKGTLQYHSSLNDNVEKVSSVLHDMSRREFHTKFNELFEKNMANRPSAGKNDWFRDEKAVFDTANRHVTSKNMGDVFETFKQQTKDIVRYRGVETLYAGGGGESYHGEDDCEGEGGTYVECYLFSKLKFDDLRKVHKDQTIFAVSESDYEKVGPKYTSLERYTRERGGHDIKPISKEMSESMLREQERLWKEKMAQKFHKSELATMAFAEKNKNVLANFLRLCP